MQAVWQVCFFATTFCRFALTSAVRTPPFQELSALSERALLSFGRQCCFGSRCLRHSRHDRIDAGIILLIWLNENVDQTKTIKTLFLVQACLHQLEVTIAFCQKRLFVSPPFLLPTALRAKEKKNRNHSLVYSREIFQLVAESQSSC